MRSSRRSWGRERGVGEEQKGGEGEKEGEEDRGKWIGEIGITAEKGFRGE
jgi:hypothetical protein